MARNKMSEVADALAAVPATTQRLRKADFTLTEDTSGSRTKIASYEAELPIAFRKDAVRMVFVAVDQFQTNGTADDTETFNLSNDIISTANTTDFVLYEEGTRVSEDSVDYAANSFDYTDDGTNNYLHAYYVPRNPVQIEIEKTAPKAQGAVSEVVYDDVTSILHERNQNKQPPEMDFNPNRPLEPVVPRKWTIDVYADGPIAFSWDDSDEANSKDTSAVNAVMSLPINRAQRDVQGLGDAVKQDIIS